MDIKMVDLYGQYLKAKPEFDAAIQNVIENTTFIKGPEVKEFEQALATYVNCKHAIGCANGTDALQIALMALDLQPGDEVITSDFTFIASVEVIAFMGLKPVVVDVYPGTFNLNIDEIRKKITPKTKAIIPVHLFGQCADMNGIMALARENGLYVVEDNAQALGAAYLGSQPTKKAGTIGHIGCTSFFPSKNLGCFGDGGAVFTDDDVLAEKMAMFANHGAKRKYYHDSIGINSRLDTMQAAILNVKIKYLDDYIKARQKAANYYDEGLLGVEAVEIPARDKMSTHVFHQYTIQVKNNARDELQAFLKDKGIPSMVYYPVPMHRQTAFAKFVNQNDEEWPVSEALSKSVLSLPMHTELDEEQLDFIISNIKIYFRT